MRGILYSIGAVAVVLSGLRPACAAEYAVLRNGAHLAADRHEAVEGKVRLYSDGGMVELPAELVERFEERPVEVSAPKPEPEAAPVTAEPAAAPAPSDPKSLAEQAARKFGLPESFVKGVMKAESAFQPGAVSPKGALGLMQLMPETARDLGVEPRNPRENAEGGAKYLRDLLAKYENEPDQVVLALAAYNAGPGAVDRFHGVPPYRETREYILRVLREWSASRARE
jgi:soluble lytic murein transglycosylase-like protein